MPLGCAASAAMRILQAWPNASHVLPEDFKMQTAAQHARPAQMVPSARPEPPIQDCALPARLAHLKGLLTSPSVKFVLKALTAPWERQSQQRAILAQSQLQALGCAPTALRDHSKSSLAVPAARSVLQATSAWKVLLQHCRVREAHLPMKLVSRRTVSASRSHLATGLQPDRRCLSPVLHLASTALASRWTLSTIRLAPSPLSSRWGQCLQGLRRSSCSHA